MSDRATVHGVDLVLAAPADHESEWIDFGHSLQRLEAAWLQLSPDEPPLNPRIVGEPGLGKTTLACAAARRLGRPVYVVDYRASSVVLAMLQGGVAVLDEGNRMPERAWASLAPLMDDRRYVEFRRTRRPARTRAAPSDRNWRCA